MKEELMAIFNTMKMIETRGESTLMMADCLRELARILNESDKESEAKE